MDEAKYLAELKRKGLILEPSSKSNHPFYLDGHIPEIIDGDPKKVKRVIRIARKYAPYDGCGQHVGLLALVASRAEIEKGHGVYWQRSYYVNDLTSMISLKDWLNEEGQFPGTIYQDKNPLNRLLNRLLC